MTSRSLAVPPGEPTAYLLRGLPLPARSGMQYSLAPAPERAVIDWVRTLMVEEYGVPEATLTPEADIFVDYDQVTGWFFAAPHPHRLADRYFARPARDGSPDR